MSALVHARKISLYSCIQYRASKWFILCAHTNKFKIFTLYIVLHSETILFLLLSGQSEENIQGFSKSSQYMPYARRRTSNEQVLLCNIWVSLRTPFPKYVNYVSKFEL